MPRCPGMAQIVNPEVVDTCRNQRGMPCRISDLPFPGFTPKGTPCHVDYHNRSTGLRGARCAVSLNTTECQPRPDQGLRLPAGSVCIRHTGASCFLPSNGMAVGCPFKLIPASAGPLLQASCPSRHVCPVRAGNHCNRQFVLEAQLAQIPSCGTTAINPTSLNRCRRRLVQGSC